MLTKVRFQGRTMLQGTGTFKVEITKAKNGSPGTIIRVPSSDAHAGRLFKTQFAFEIVQPNGVIHTMCATSAVGRREVLEGIDARRRGGSCLNDFRSAYLGQPTAPCAGVGKKGKKSGGRRVRLLSQELRQQKAEETAEWAVKHLPETAMLPCGSLAGKEKKAECECEEEGGGEEKSQRKAPRRKSSFFARVLRRR